MQLCLANFKDFGPSTKYRNGRGVPKAARCRNRSPADARRPAASPLTTTASLEAKAAATSSSAATMEIRPLSHPAAPETRKQPCQMMIRSNPDRPSRIGRTPGSNRWTANEIPSSPALPLPLGGVLCSASHLAACKRRRRGGSPVLVPLRRRRAPPGACSAISFQLSDDLASADASEASPTPRVPRHAIDAAAGCHTSWMGYPIHGRASVCSPVWPSPYAESCFDRKARTR